MQIAALILSVLGIIATVLVAWLINTKTTRLLKRINAIQVARVNSKELGQMEHLIDDIERTGEKRGTVVQKPDGSWAIEWAIDVGGGVVKPVGVLKTRRFH